MGLYTKKGKKYFILRRKKKNTISRKRKREIHCYIICGDRGRKKKRLDKCSRNEIQIEMQMQMKLKFILNSRVFQVVVESIVVLS